MPDPEKQPDITDAPTYADLLEEAGRASFSYSTRGALRSFTCIEWFGCIGLTIIFLLPLFGIIFVFLLSRRYVPIGEVIGMIIGILFWPTVGWSIFAMTKIRRLVRIDKGAVTLYRWLIPYAKIEIADVRWIGVLEGARFLFLTRGRRQAIPISLTGRHGRAENKLFGMMAELGRLKVVEDAENFLESEIPVPIPLTEGATRRRLPGMVRGLFCLLPFAVLFLLGAGIFIYEGEELTCYFVPVLIALGLYFLILFLRGIKRAVSSYGLSREEFTKTGYRARDLETPYADMKLTLYRGLGDIWDPDPGVLEIRLPDKKPIYIGPERQNFFVLPFILEEWAEKSFRIEPLENAPEGVRGIPFYDRLWQPPEGSYRLFGRRSG